MRALISTSNLLKLPLAGALLLGLTLSTGCSKYKLEPPTDFVEVHAYSSEVRMKAQDNVGLNLRAFKNVRGGSLSFWGSDLVDKLSDRGYRLVAQAPARSKNGVVGTRFDFDYTPQGKETPKFYIAVLFVTDEYRFVLQVAGDKAREAAYTGRIDEITDDLKVRGCAVASKICKGPQPPQLRRSGPAGPKGPAGDEPKVATGDAAPVESGAASEAPGGSGGGNGAASPTSSGAQPAEGSSAGAGG